MISKRIIWAFICCCLPMLLQAQTVVVPELYRAEVLVPDNSAESQNEAFRQGLIQVLVRLSGSRAIEHMPESEAILAKAPRYALGYSYNRVEASEEEEAKLTIRIEFDGPALERVLHKAGLPVWAAKRPSVLVWLAVEQGRKRSILAEDSESQAVQHLQQGARERGIPLILPLMDLEDRRHVEFGDIRAGFFDTLSQAAQRYNTDMMLIGWLKKARSGDWVVTWTVQRGNTSSRWREDSLPLEEAVRSGVEGLADIMASRYAFSATPDSQLNEYVVAIGQLMSLEHYAAVLNMLQGMIFIEHVTPAYIAADQAAFKVLMRGPLAELEKSLMLSNRLLPASEDNIAAPAAISKTMATDLQFVLYR